MKEIENKSDKYIAALAVRMHSLEIVKQGLDQLFKSNAIADYRDIISALVLYYDAAQRLGADADRFLLDYANQSENFIKSHITRFVSRTPALKEISVGGYIVINDPEFKYEG
jgi:hypothetical protein